MQAEVAIVGSGLVGAAIAHQLGRRGLDVLVLEAGGARGRRAGEHLRNLDLDPARFLESRASCLEPIVPRGGQDPKLGLPAAARVRAIGGAGTVWSGIAPRLPSVQRAAFLAESEWASLYDRAERLLGVAPPAWTDDATALARRLEPVGAFRPAPLAAAANASGWIWRSPARLLFDESAGLRVVPEHSVVGLQHADGRVRSAVVKPDGDGPAVHAEAGVWILAAGPIGTPQLLAASAVGDEATRGRWLTEHVLAHAIVECAAPLGRAAPGPFLERMVAEDGAYALLWRDACDPRLLAGADPARTVHLFWYGSMEPRWENRVAFGPSKDASGSPAPRFEVRRTREDEEAATRLLEDLRRAAPLVGCPLRGAPPQLLPPGSAQHILGTTRMAAAAREGVVDPDGRAWGFENLYLAGTGVIGGSTSVPPTLTAVALGLHTADVVAARLGRGPAADSIPG
jgi:choline dehydrogenase-like flavoprotein